MGKTDGVKEGREMEKDGRGGKGRGEVWLQFQVLDQPS